MRLAVLVLLAAAPAFSQPAPVAPTPPGAAAPAAGGPMAPVANPAGWKEQFDELWKKRDSPGATVDLHSILSAQLAAEPRSFEANWRLAQLYNWEANAFDGGDQKADLGHKAWDAGDIAMAVKPDDVRGQYQAGTGLGQYSEGIGILKALSQGIEGKFRDRIQAALRIDKDYLDGMPQVVWGRYFFKLPWPKRDVDQSIRVLTAALEGHPHNLRARLYLADSLSDEGSIEDARKLIKEIIDAPAGEDPPETRLVQASARKWQAAH